MAHHLVDLDWGFLNRLTNVLLTREPRDMLHSYSKTIPEFGLADTGYDKLKRIADGIIVAGRTPIVIDSKRLLESPESVLRNLCGKVGVDFHSSMLSWEAGPKKTTVSGHPIGITMPTDLLVSFPTSLSRNLFLIDSDRCLKSASCFTIAFCLGRLPSWTFSRFKKSRSSPEERDQNGWVGSRISSLFPSLQSERSGVCRLPS